MYKTDFEDNFIGEGLRQSTNFGMIYSVFVGRSCISLFTLFLAAQYVVCYK